MKKVNLSTIGILMSVLLLASCSNTNEAEINTVSSGAEIQTESVDETLGGDVQEEVVEQEVLEAQSTSGSEVTVNDIKEGTRISSGELVIGTVSVEWYKDSQFPVSLVSEDGEILATTMASGEVIDEEGNPTGDIVQYVAELDFEIPEGTTKAILKLESANSNDVLEIPVSL